MKLKVIKKSHADHMYPCDDAGYCIQVKRGISIIYAYEDSDVFYPAKLVKHGSNCLCFETERPIALGEKIYIITQDFPLDDTHLKIYEGCFAQVRECKKSHDFNESPSYSILVKSMNVQAVNISSNALSAEIL